MRIAESRMVGFFFFWWQRFDHKSWDLNSRRCNELIRVFPKIVVPPKHPRNDDF